MCFRLDLGYVDLFLIHAPTTDGKVVETYKALLDLKQKGLIRYGWLYGHFLGTRHRAIILQNNVSRNIWLGWHFIMTLFTMNGYGNML